MIYSLRLPRWNDVLLAIYRCRDNSRYCEKLNRKVKASRTHLREIVKLLARQRLIRIVPGTKVKLLQLTSKGRRIAACILEIRSELSRP